MRLPAVRRVQIVMTSRSVLVLVLAACGGSDLKRSTHAFVASTSCGQGPYDLHLRADGTTGGDGIEIIACTPRRISGRVMFKAGAFELANRAFGDGADNARCVGGAPTITTTTTTTAATADAGAGSGAGGRAGSVAAPTLVARPFTGSETPFADELCGRLGLTAQEVLMPTILERTSQNELPAGTDLHVRLWSDAPNDLEGVVFMVRHLTSKKTPQQVQAEVARDRKRDRDRPREAAAPRARTPHHGPPPAPLLEERPPQPQRTARWVPGYWTWTGAAWGWVAGFWRGEMTRSGRVGEMTRPGPRIDVPGPPPRPGAVWIGGTWTVRAGQYVWITGRWRR